VGRFVGILAGVLVLFWIISDPVSAAATVSNILKMLGSFANSLVTYVQNLAA